jgi:hypothetical protein
MFDKKAFTVALLVLCLLFLGIGSAFVLPMSAFGDETNGILFPSAQLQLPAIDSTASADSLLRGDTGATSPDTPSLLIEIALLVINLI